MSELTKDGRNTRVGFYINGVECTDEVAPRLLSMTFTDNEDGEDDDLEMTLEDRDNTVAGEWLLKEIEERADANRGGASKWNIVPTIWQKNWNEGEEISLKCGKFELDDLSVKGAPQTVTIKCTSCSFNSATRKRKRTKVWKKTTLKKIGSYIAKRGGFALMYLTDKKVEYKRVKQTKQTDMKFLRSLCSKAGLNCKTTNSTIVIYDPEEYEGKTEVKTITKGDGSYSSYNLQAKLSDTCYDGCEVSYTNPSTGKTIKGTYPTGIKTSSSKKSSSSTYTGKEVDAEYTAYYPANNRMEGGLYDCTGKRLVPSAHTCAAPPQIALNKKILVSGTGTSKDGQVYTVNDRGGAIKIVNGVYHIDLLVASASEANSFGRRRGKALIITNTVSTKSSSSSSKSTKSTTTSSGSSTVGNTVVAKAVTYKGRNLNPGYAWCAWFVAKILTECGVSSSKVPHKGYTMVSQFLADAKRLGRFHYASSGYIPSPGDIFIEKENGHSHTGFVKSASASGYTTIEGNSSNLVQSHRRSYSYQYLTGFYHPNYGGSTTVGSSSSSSSKDESNILKITNEKVDTKAEAKALAKARLREANKGEITASFTMAGDITLCAGLTVKLKDFGAFSGKYIIEQSQHSITKSGGYKTTISIRRVIKYY